MPIWFQASYGVWHLTATQGRNTIVPCLNDLFVVTDGNVWCRQALPESGIVCIRCIRCWNAANMFVCEEQREA